MPIVQGIRIFLKNNGPWRLKQCDSKATTDLHILHDPRASYSNYNLSTAPNDIPSPLLSLDSYSCSAGKRPDAHISKNAQDIRGERTCPGFSTTLCCIHINITAGGCSIPLDSLGPICCFCCFHPGEEATALAFWCWIFVCLFVVIFWDF